MFPISDQASNVHATRRIGLGLTGLGDALAMLGQRYDGWTARGLAADVVRRMCMAAYAASIDLAAERGAFPACEREAFLAGRFVARLPGALREKIARQGIRNSHLLAVAPAGTISLLAGNVSGGIEPIFALEGERRVLDASGSYQVHRVRDYAWNLWRTRYPREPVPDSLVTAHEIDPRSQVEMQAVVQPWVDNAISKTINVSAATSFEEFQGLYGIAHSLGLKGCTVFRPSPQRGEVLAAAPGDTLAHCCDPDREAD
jgi:ribonucleoside-diphosphate reductase alpha chain